MSACTAPLHCGVTGCLLPGKPSTGCDCICHPQVVMCPDCNHADPYGPDFEGFYDCPECGAAWKQPA